CWQRSSENETHSSDEESSEDEFIKRLNNIRRTSVKFDSSKAQPDNSNVKASALQAGEEKTESKNGARSTESTNISFGVPTRPSISLHRSSISSKSSDGSRKSPSKDSAKKPLKISSKIQTTSKVTLSRRSSVQSSERGAAHVRSNSADSGSKK
uniref:Uncharacterized protein n=1 Tax=Parascaris univalens TaxID=6257 RepID=A0A915CE77_PARUN